MHTPSPRAFSIVGLLVTMVCIVVLFSIMMNSTNKAVTGAGSQTGGSVRSFEDKMYLNALFQSMVLGAQENKDRFLIPSEFARSNDQSLNTTANLFSAMVMAQYTPPKQLISGNEYSGYVEEKIDYDLAAYDPSGKTVWDTSFKADLKKLSNVSFANMPLIGDRFDKNWRATMNASFPLIGNRGPKDGINDPQSFACGRDGVWRGHLVFGDGHVEFIDTPTRTGLTTQLDGKSVPDNIFIMESGPKGNDAILGFTKTMKKDGPELQFD